MADAQDGYWELAKADETGHFIFNYQTCVARSGPGGFEIESG